MNLFKQWKVGMLPNDKIYLIRIHYLNSLEEDATCLKLGFTSQPLHQRIINVLGSMHKSTGLTILNYELLKLSFTPKNSQVEYALHRRAEHLYFYNQCGDRVCFKGSTEILKDTAYNIDLLQSSPISYHQGEVIIPYRPRKTSSRGKKYMYDTLYVV